MPHPAPCLLLAFFFFFALAQSSSEHRDRICHYPAPGAAVEFVYLITSVQSVFAAESLPPNAISFHLHLPAHNEDQSCSCCFGLQNDNSVLRGMRQQGSSSSRLQHARTDDARRLRSSMRNLLWSKAAAAIGAAARYIVLLDATSGMPHISVLQQFQSWLLLQSPIVGVPFHPCNMNDTNATNSASVLSVSDVGLVAIHRSAVKLLLPLDEAIFPLLCHIMLRGTVMQFDSQVDFGLDGSSTPAAACTAADAAPAANQDALVDFISSLRVEAHARAIPFSPRMQPAAAAPPVLVFRHDGSIASPSSATGCAVECSMSYWLQHPAFDCCSRPAFAPAAAVPYDAQAAYINISRTWNLPRRANLAGNLSTAWPSPYNSGVNRRYRSSLLTHPLPKFEIVLDGPPVVVEPSAFYNKCHDAGANLLHSFTATLQPDKFELHSNHGKSSSVSAVFQLTISSEAWSHADQDAGYAVFGRLDSLRFDTVCDGSESSALVDAAAVVFSAPTDTEFSSGIAPWFYNPGPGWFEVASRITRDAPDSLRSLLFNATLGPPCDGRMFISATAAVALHAVAAFGAPCRSHIVSVSSHNVSYDAWNETRRASVLGEDAPADLFNDDSASSLNSRVPRSDFSCAGPNRMWHYDEQDHTRLFERVHNGEFVNMCLLHNVCWMDGSLVLYLPPPLADLEAMGLFQFPSLGIGNPWIGHDQRRFSWAPQIKFESFPEDVRFALNVTHFLMLKSLPHHEIRNMGHILLEDLASAFHAMESFDLLDAGGRIVLHQNVSVTDHIRGLIPASRSYPFFLFPHTTTFIEDYPSGTCFERMVVGQLAVEWLWQFSLHRAGHYSRFRMFYLRQLQLEHVVSSWYFRPRVIVNFYPRVVMGSHKTWIDVCKLSRQLRDTFPDAEFRCISMHSMVIELQVQLIAAAVVHVWPNGGSAYGLIFAADGASAVVLTDDGKPAMETKLLMMLPWTNVYYMHRQEESFFPLFLFRAMSSASLRMKFPMPYSKLSEISPDD